MRILEQVKGCVLADGAVEHIVGKLDHLERAGVKSLLDFLAVPVVAGKAQKVKVARRLPLLARAR
jgi:hypothetical protein